MGPTMEVMKVLRESGSRRSLPSLMYPLRPLGNSSTVGNDVRPSVALDHSFCSASARNLTTLTPLGVKCAAASSYPGTMAWQNGHHGAYSTASVVCGWSASKLSASICARLKAVTAPPVKMSSSVASRAAACSSVRLALCSPHSFMAASSHHHRPSRSCCPGSTARVQGAHPMDTYPISCSLFTGVPMTRRKSHTSRELARVSGLNLMSEPGPPAAPSNTGSTCTAGTAMRVPGDWSLRCPVTHALSVRSFFFSGCTLRTPQHSLWPSS
mmetsp:Transcript_38829/g.96306  ORF Transcript_38829/g.96306 Transcript_38829/m.96306 type:complete len:269 (-) Transcript_38829:599-1405(-)